MIQTIECKCGNTFAACAVPDCYTDTKWQKELRKYVNEGCTVSLKEDTSLNFKKCTCNDELDNLTDIFDTVIVLT